MRKVYLILKKLVPEFGKVYELLRVNLLQPLFKGTMLLISNIKLGGKGSSVLSRLEEAIEKASTDLITSDRITEAEKDKSMVD